MRINFLDDRTAFRKAYPKVDARVYAYLYALKEPGSDAIKYVGVTNNPIKRLAHHRLVACDTAKGRWVRFIGADRVEMEVLMLGETEYVYRTEQTLVRAIETVNGHRHYSTFR